MIKNCQEMVIFSLLYYEISKFSRISVESYVGNYYPGIPKYPDLRYYSAIAILEISRQRIRAYCGESESHTSFSPLCGISRNIRGRRPRNFSSPHRPEPQPPTLLEIVTAGAILSAFHARASRKPTSVIKPPLR